MKNTILGFAAAAVLSLTVGLPAMGAASQAFAAPDPNGHNCLGVDLASETPPGAGSAASGIARSGPGAIAEAVSEVRHSC